MKLKDVLTTGEVADFLKVTTNTVAKWFDQGLIKGFKHPGSNTRRVSKKDLEKFLKKNDIPFNRFQKEPFLTTAQCAKLCFVTTNTVTKWIDKDLLPGFNLGTERRLVFYRDLVRFMKSNKIPLARLKNFKPPEPGQRPMLTRKKKSNNGRRKNKSRKRGRPKKR